MHSDGVFFNQGVERVADELVSLLSDRIDQVDRDARAFCRHPDVGATMSQVTHIEATGTIDALRWTIARVQELRGRYGAS